jgi:hypothetical protein
MPMLNLLTLRSSFLELTKEVSLIILSFYSDYPNFLPSPQEMKVTQINDYHQIAKDN